MTTTIVLPILALLVAGGTHSHNHITIDTSSGQPGDQISIIAGFYPDESGYSIDPDGTLLLDGVPAEYHLEETVSAPGHNGWLGADSLLLTSDFFFATGRLDGGNFAFEITSVVPSNGLRTAARVAWGDYETGSLSFSADSGAATRAARSFIVGAGGHTHGQVFAISEPGEYDVTFIAWDLNGRYADSSPVTVHMHAVPPHCAQDINADGEMNTLDLIALLGRFGQSAAPGDATDINGDGVVDTLDLTSLLGKFGQAC